MPRGLAMFTKVFLVFAFLFPPIFLLVLLSYPLGNHTIKGVPVFTFGEFWQRMEPSLALGFAVGVTRWWLKIRAGLVAHHFRTCVLFGFVIHHATSTAPNYLFSLLSLAFFVWYLFFRQTVKDYYARAREPVAEHYETDF